MPDLNLAGSAVQSYMFELTKELKAKSRHQEVKKIQIPKTSEKYHMDLMQMNLTRTKRLKMLAIGKLTNILLFLFLKTKSW
jgi:hypothetical protein